VRQAEKGWKDIGKRKSGLKDFHTRFKYVDNRADYKVFVY